MMMMLTKCTDLSAIVPMRICMYMHGGARILVWVHVGKGVVYMYQCKYEVPTISFQAFFVWVRSGF